MTFAPKTATALVLVLASTLSLAACGGDAEVSDEPADSVTEATPTPAPVDGAPDAADPAPAPADSASPETSAAPMPAAAPDPAPSPAAATTVAAKPPEFAVCAACHSTEPGKNGIGPTLAGVFGKRAGHISSFDYSDEMESSGMTWNQANLDRFLTDPKGVMPGTKMVYPGLRDAAKRQAMIAYLKSL